MSKNKADAYNSDSELNAGGIFDDFGFDEMQKIESYEIGFKLFRVMFLAVLACNYAVTIWCCIAENFIGTVLSVIMFAVFYGFHVMYAYLTAEKGIMNPKFARRIDKKYTYPCLAVLFLLSGIFLAFELRAGGTFYDIVRWILLLIFIAESWVVTLCAKKNNRVVAEQFKED